ncbi:S8 family serine peptidase [Desulfosporosinus sp. PR]|uniref:S8 family serine peptidase n=1 Tax=Candidatus Desulfosporosinus nitrosoreducens TaxID=3401928 RepID=UPI0027FA687B|nr:S8 family serine peptidase [Desulfosporosinus sp. PR]MDQ7093823.1 S8 family serine peptidase [Desulfosporosinus sp. PR]
MAGPTESTAINSVQQDQSNGDLENVPQLNNESKQTNLPSSDNEQTIFPQEQITIEDQEPEQLLKPSPSDQETAGISEGDNLPIDRFIVKYKDENQKESTFSKLRGNLKARKLTRNRSFDVYITSKKMKRAEFTAFLQQQQADSNIEYIQPDYMMTLASADPPQLTENQQQTPSTEQTEQTDNAAVTDPNQTQTNDQHLQLSAATFDGLKISLTYNETLKPEQIPAKNDFKISTKDGKDIVINDIELMDNNLILTLTAPLTANEPVIASYAPGSSPIQDLSGNLAEGFSNKVIANLSEPINNLAPVLQTATIKADTLELTFSKQLNVNSLPAKEDFSINLNSTTTSQAINTLTLDANKVTITLMEPVTASDSVEVSYTPSQTPLMDIDGNGVLEVTPFIVKNITGIEVNDPHYVEQWGLEEIKATSATNAAMTVANQADSATNAALSSGNQAGITTDTPAVSIKNQEKVTTGAASSIEDQVKETTGTTISSDRSVNVTTNSAITIGSDAVNAWPKSEGEGVIVAVLDTGIDITQEDLEDNIWTNTKETDNNGIDDDMNGYSDDIHGWNFADDTNAVHNLTNSSDEWHGTHIAGIIAAAMGNGKGIAGVAPMAKIMPLQVFKNGKAYTSDIISAIEYAKENGARIVNCSWGTTSENIALKEAMDESGLLFICAAGNSNQDIDANPVYPASYTSDNIIAVASLNRNGNLSWFSNYGLNSVDVAAPGEEIVSTTPGNTYSFSGGTSQAAAFVTGEAALILSKYPQENCNDVKARIIDSCDRLSSLTGKTVSGGIINCTAALNDPISTNDTIIPIPADQTKPIGTIIPSNGDYNLYAVDGWVTRGNLQTARMDFGTATVNDKIYCIGGSNNGNCLNSVEAFDPATGTSTLLKDMNIARYVPGVASADGKIYAIGGYNGGCLDTAEEYDPATNVWTTTANMPTPRSFLGAAAVDGKIYAIGGLNNTGPLNTVEEYDPATNTWSTKAGMPTARSALGVIAVNNKIYAIGGSANWNSLNTLEEYDPLSNTWTTKASMPISMQVFGVATSNGKIYTMGGYNTASQKVVYEYDPSTNVWGRMADLTLPRYGVGSAAAAGRLYALGGYNGSYLNSVEESELPLVLQDLSATSVTSTSITLNWGAVRNATGYDIEVDGTVINNGTNTSYVHSGLSPNITHTYRYRAKNGSVVSEWSALLAVATLAPSQGNSGTFVPNNINVGDTFNLVINGSYLTTPTRTITITYNAGDAQLLDLCGFTNPMELTSGPISNTTITVNRVSPGTISFTVNLPIPSGKSWSGILNVIKFKANVSNPRISYTAY